MSASRSLYPGDRDICSCSLDVIEGLKEDPSRLLKTSSATLHSLGQLPHRVARLFPSAPCLDQLPKYTPILDTERLGLVDW